MKRNWRKMLAVLLVLMALTAPLTVFAADSGRGRGELLIDEFCYETAALKIPENSLGEWEFYGGEEYSMYVELENTSETRTVSQYTMEVEALDAFGFPLEASCITVAGKISPGERTWSGSMEMCFGADVYVVYAYIDSVEYTDGTSERIAHPVKGYWYVE